MTERPPTALVLRALGLGDLITGLPALRLLRQALPEHRIVLAAPLHWAPLVELAGTVDDLVAGSELTPLIDPPYRPDVAVDLHGNGPESRALLEACEPSRLLAYAGGPVEWRHAEHEVARWCRLLREGLPALGVTVPDGPDPQVAGVLGVPPLPPTSTIPHGATVVHCGAAAPSRRWPPDRFAEVVRHLAAAGHDVVITGGAAERDLATGIAAAAGVRAATTLTLLQLCELVGTARLVVSGDTGVAHLASAYAVASVTLFGPVSPLRWGPPQQPRHQVLWHGDDTGDPHGTTVDPALLAITVAEVLAAADAANAAGGDAAPATVATDAPAGTGTA